MNWEATFTTWAQGPSEAEKKKCENTERAIYDAIEDDPDLARMDIKVSTQGSYQANTNVKQDSDVDVCVLDLGHILGDYPTDTNSKTFGLQDTEFTYKKFKDLVENALVRKFGRLSVQRGNKAFNISANSYRVDADVVAAFEHRRYSVRPNGTHVYLSGIEFHPDDDGRVINWPDQTHVNGCNKNDATNRRYKRVIRILKHLRNKMQDEDIKEANDIGSFLIESLVWNVPNGDFGKVNYTADVRAVLAHTFNQTLAQDKCNEWGEVNELKYLFKGGQWDRDKAHKFLSASWDYLGLV